MQARAIRPGLDRIGLDAIFGRIVALSDKIRFGVLLAASGGFMVGRNEDPAARVLESQITITRAGQAAEPAP